MTRLATQRRAAGYVLAPLVWVERVKGRKRLALLALYGLFALLVGSLIWRATSLRTLPDLGEPFDVAAFQAYRVPPEEDAFTLYRQAVAAYIFSAETQDYARMWAFNRGGWSQASPALREWVEQNRDALKLWRQGTDRIRAMPDPPEVVYRHPSKPRAIESLMRFNWMALLEGSRLEEAGDMAGAWGWYNAALRASRHVGMHATLMDRALGAAMLSAAADRVAPWAADPRVDAATLRRALNDLITIEAMTGPNSDAIKAEYLGLTWAADNPDRWLDYDRPEFSLYSRYPALFGLVKFYKREPERSRRVLKIIYAHWLAYADRPPAQRPRMSETRMIGNQSFPDFPYYVAPGKEDAAHPLSPDRLYGWYNSMAYMTCLALGFNYSLPQCDIERNARSVLIVTMADYLYQRERGKMPNRAEDLVAEGYLKSLPPEYEDSLFDSKNVLKILPSKGENSPTK